MSRLARNATLASGTLGCAYAAYVLWPLEGERVGSADNAANAALAEVRMWHATSTNAQCLDAACADCVHSCSSSLRVRAKSAPLVCIMAFAITFQVQTMALVLWTFCEAEQGLFRPEHASRHAREQVNCELDATKLPTRKDTWAALRAATAGAPLDILVIGGGATGAGAALDAATRNLNVALVEQSDFAAGTSSRSTKLVHGGVRYLEKAVFKLDYSQLQLVFEALHERRTMLENAPHLARPLPIMTVRSSKLGSVLLCDRRCAC